MKEFFFNFIGFSLLGAVAIVLILGIYTLFKGGSTSKKYSNKLMQLKSAFAIYCYNNLGFNGLFSKKLNIFF